ncbi:MAG: FkbM family methyltransferase [Bacteroidales bacterium]|nr:FkbM family methyltransferase [Bacteroidales bacterium]
MKNYNGKSLQKVYESLGDDLSRQLFFLRVMFSVTDNFFYIDEILKLCFPGIKLIERNKQQIVYGAGGGGKVVNDLVIGSGSGVKCFWDRDYSIPVNAYRQKPILPPGSNYDGEQIILATSNMQYRDEMRENCRLFGIPEDRIIFDWITPFYNQYFAGDIVQYEKNEVFVDCGAYDFLNSLDFLKRCNSVKRIYAFEPNVTKLLLDNIASCGFSEIKLIEAAVGEEPGEISFDITDNGSGSHIVANGSEENRKVKVVRIDDMIDINDKVTFIKMDLEGYEVPALLGAQSIIQRDKPKLAISIYHKKEDIFEIPCLLHEMVADYKFFIRQYSLSRFETVLYAILPGARGNYHA